MKSINELLEEIENLTSSEDFTSSEKAKNVAKALEWVERKTALTTRQSRMLSNGEQALFLQALSMVLEPKRILEIGTFTGYSSICFSRGLASGGKIDTIEIFDELQKQINEGFQRADIIDSVNLHIGDAKEIIPSLEHKYDLIFIDANKREYLDYYNLVFDKLAPNGLILADNVLWSGKIDDPASTDPQTRAIIEFNTFVEKDSRVESHLLKLRDGVYLIRVKGEG